MLINASVRLRFATSYIHDILSAYERYNHDGAAAVAYLQRTFPQSRYETEARFAGLSRRTIAGWYGEDKQLLPKYRDLLRTKASAVSRGVGTSEPMFAQHADVEKEAGRILLAMRERGAAISRAVAQHILRIVVQERAPALLLEYKISLSFVSRWLHSYLGWSSRVQTGAASKLPADWRQQGIDMAMRIAFNMQVHKVHPSLIVNMDQTGVHLAPSSGCTFAPIGSKDVKVIAADDKRQITVCIASSLDGDLLPLQLIFEGSTLRCEPKSTRASDDAHVHLTHSINHWSSQETMRQWVEQLLMPYCDRRILEHNLPHESHIVLVLDVWSVHKSEEFRGYMRERHPRIHLVFVPANCTSKLQVADVVLQRPFKHGIRMRFNNWAAEILREQVKSGKLDGLAPHLKMAAIKPQVLEWVLGSWSRLQQGRDYIKMGWHTCVLSNFNVLDVAKRTQAVELVALKQIQPDIIPDGEEDSEADEESDHEEDEEKDELDVLKERQYGTRKSARKRAPPRSFGHCLVSSQIEFSSDSE